ncbi:MAG: ATP synthase F1 subunit gamma [Muribaculaceae bacterium]|nr:ATP synthase F1 subunit gamma [Muribaculaceae bacterium]
MRELKTRIGSVSSSEKITGAMKMISSAKVHKNEQELRRLLPFKSQLQQIMGHILSSDVNFTSPLIEEREVKRVGLVLFGSDDGLCGAYNLNIFKKLLEEVAELRHTYGGGVAITVFPVGKKVARACTHLKVEGIDVRILDDVNSKMLPAKVDDFTLTLKTAFTEKEFDTVKVVYMKFFSISRQRPTVDTLFPVKEELLLEGAGEGVKKENRLYIFEPDPNRIFNEVLPMFVLSMMQEITIENRASEQAARVMAMQAANDNAKKLNEELQLEYNKLRQQSITTELLDILGGQVER